MSPRVIIIADDLTGAADTGATFAAQGAKTLVVWAEGPLPRADVLVLSTESRHLEREAAVRAVSAVAGRLQAGTYCHDRHWIYKKIDSTLRGHPGPELAALMQGLGIEGALVAPAFPNQGRTTRQGLLLVEGVPLTSTVFGREVASSDLRTLFGAGFQEGRLKSLPLHTVREGGATAMHAASIWIADAETDADLALLVRAAPESTIRLLCGSAGLAQALAGMLARDYGWQAPAEGFAELELGGQGVLIVAASRHPRTLTQVAAAAAAGIPVICPEPGWFTGDSGTDKLTDDLVEALSGGAAVLTTAGLPDMPCGGGRLTERLAQGVEALVAHRSPKGLVLTGGDAAIAVSHVLRAEALQLRGELARGVPWGTFVGGVIPGLPVVTKAGGFGDEDTFLAAIRFFQRR
jgi:D-threonate/D-erythronate kinase